MNNGEQAQTEKDARFGDAEIRPLTKFEPSSETKQLLFGTRKSKDWKVGGILLPGLFSSENKLGDRRWLYFAGVLELLGLLALCYALWEETSLSVSTVIGIGLVVIFFDLAFAWIHHFVIVPVRCKNENEKLRVTPKMRDETETKEDTYEDLKNRYNISWWRYVVFYIVGGGIVFLGILKAIVFTIHLPQYWSGQIKTVVLIPCLMSYFIVAYIHLTKTGYCFAYWRFWISEYLDKKKYNTGTEKRKGLTREWHKVIINLQEFVNNLKQSGYEEWRPLINRDYQLIENEVKNGLTTELGRYKRGEHKIKILCQLNQQSFDKLKEDGVPESVINNFRDLKGTEYAEDEFLEVIRKKIGDNEFIQFKSLILKYAKQSDSYSVSLFIKQHIRNVRTSLCSHFL